MHTSKKTKTKPPKPNKPTNLRNVKGVVGDPSEAAETRYSLRPRSTTTNLRSRSTTTNSTSKTKSTSKPKSTKTKPTKTKSKAKAEAIKLPRGSCTAENDTINDFGPSSMEDMMEDDFNDSGSKGRFEEKMAEKGSSSELSSLTPSPVMITIAEAYPLNDWNERQSERTDLLKDLKRLLGDEPIPPTFWACSQLADTQCLKYLMEGINNYGPILIKNAIENSRDIVKQWTQHARNTASRLQTETLATDSSRRSKKVKLNAGGELFVSRSQEARNLCLQRDNNMCILTKAKNPQVVHIYPYSLINNPGNSFERPTFWSLLRVFWSARRVQEWRDEIHRDPQNPGTGTEGCFNLLCLNPNAHDWWNRGLFALKPLDRSEDRTTLTCQFFWQPQYSHTWKSNVDLLMGPLLSRGLTRVDNYQLVHSEYKDGLPQPIRSGDMFTLTTDDPDKKPLPSFKLLELQWILQKITAMSGDDGESSSDSSSDWVYDWIPPPPLQDSSPDVAKAVIKLQNPDPRGVFYEPLEHLQGSTPIVC